MELPSIFLNRILAETAKRGASTLHLSVGNPPLLRLDNALSPIEGENIISADELSQVLDGMLSEEEKALLVQKKELVLVRNFAGTFRFRMNFYYQKDMPSVSCHYISNKIPSFADLRLPEAFSRIMNLNAGLFIIAGPFSSGKSTTGSALIEEINKGRRKYIITLEYPIERIFIGKSSIIEQQQIGRDTTTLLAGLEHCLDEDEDIVYIGEFKDEFDEALPLIMDLASGNALVFLEMNADNSIRVLERLIDSLKKKMSIEAARYYLADVLMGIHVQKLFPKRGGGMSMASELMLANHAIKSLIRDGKIYQIDSIIQTSRQEGMISLSKSIEELEARGEVKREDVLINGL